MATSPVTQRSSLLLTAPLLLCAALAGCSSSTPSAPGASTAPTSAAPPSVVAASSAPTPAASTAAGSDGGSGTITFKGKIAGKMTISDCPDGKTAQLNVDVDGQDSSYSGVIDASDFAITGPNSTAYSLPAGKPKPKVSGKTYTVEDAELVSVVNVKDVVTASGSVTCP